MLLCLPLPTQELLQQLLPPRAGEILARVISQVQALDSNINRLDAQQVKHGAQISQMVYKLGGVGAVEPTMAGTRTLNRQSTWSESWHI